MAASIHYLHQRRAAFRVGSCWRDESNLFQMAYVFFFSQQRLALGSSAIKVLGQNDTFVFWGSLQQLAFASQKVLWSVPQTVLYIGLTVSCGFLGNGCCFRKGSVEGSANFSLYLSPKWLLLHKSYLEGSASCALHLSPSLLLR